MGQGTLVDIQLAGGKALLQSLHDSGFDVTVGGWTKSEEGDWKLDIASRDVEDRGIADAYETVFTAIQSKPELGIDPFDVKLIERQIPIAEDLLAIRGSGLPGATIRSRRPYLGHMSVDETYVYPA